MAPQSDANTDQRVPLSRDRVLRAAINLVDSAGIESLTMRRLGQELGVEAMSLYNHVANKDDILSGIAELVFSEIALPSGNAGWKAALRGSAISAHNVLRRHPWAHSITMTPEKPSPARLRWMEGVLGTLRIGGFSAELTCHAYHALDSHVTGFTLWQASIPVAGDALRELAATGMQTFPVDDYPYVAEHIEQHLRPPSPDDRGAFAFGLDLILDGLERIRDTA